MTYEEIKSKLTKCEKKLKELQTSSSKPKNYEQSVSKLNILKESLEKQLKEAEKGIVYTDDEEKAKDLADDGTNVKLTKESEFQGKYQFDVNETKAIAKKVGKAVAMAVKDLSSDVKHMKAVNIKPDSFNIRIIFKNGSDDEFKFFIEEDTLHLADFSYDKELVSVGVKPDGEAIVHVEHLANVLIKVLKEKMYEGMSNQEFADAKEKDRLEKHPDKEKIKAIQALIQNANKNEGEYAAGKGQLNVYGYQTKHFDICPGAVSLFKKILKEKDKDEDDVKDLAIHHDYLFLLEKIALDMEVSDRYDNIKAVLKRTGKEGKFRRDKFLEKAKGVADDIYQLGDKLGLDANHRGEDLSYIQNHIEKINDALREDGVNEAPDNKYYIKVSRNDKGSQNALQDAMETWHDPFRFTDIEDDRKDNYVTFYFNKKDWNPGMKDDIEGNGVDIIDTNIPDFHEDSSDVADTDYMQRRRAEKDYQQESALGFSDIEKLGSKAASDIDISVRRDPNYTFGKRPGDDDRLRYKYAKQLGYLNEKLTPLQQYVYDYEKEVSGEDNAKDFLNSIKKLNSPDDVYNYYAYERDWEGDSDLEDDLENIYNQVLDKFSLKEAMDGGQLFDYFAKQGYDVTERRPDGKEAGFDGYMVSKGSGRSPQAVIFQYDKDVDQFMISRMSGYRIDQKEAIKAGMRQAGRSGVAGIDSYMTDGNYNPVDISAEGLKDIVDHVMGGLEREAKAQADFYRNRGPVSGTIDELKSKIASIVKEKLSKNIKEFKVGDKVTYLGHPGEITKVNKEMTGAITYNVSYDKGNGKTKATNIYNKGGEIKAVEEKLTKKSSVEKHIEDFKDSDAPQFKGKSQEKRRKMAVAAYLSKKNDK